MFRIFKTQPLKSPYSKKEVSAAKFIPYRCHWNQNTILTKSNELLQVVKINGFAFETADDIEIEIKKNMRNQLYKNVASGSIVLYFHTIRKRKSLLDSDHVAKSVDRSDFTSYLNHIWNAKYSTSDSYFNEIYVSILYKPDKAGLAMLEYLVKKFKATSDKHEWEKEMQEMTENIEELTTRIVNTFSDYGVELLGLRQINGVYYCSILEFLSTIVNCGYNSNVIVPQQTIDGYLCNHRLFFGNRSIEASGPGGKRYAGIVSVADYGPYTYAGVLDRFLQLPFEFVITQSFVFANRTVAIQKMQLQQNRMIQSEDKAVSQIKEISVALDMAMSGEISFGEHHFTIMCVEKNVKALENVLSIAAVELSNCGIRGIRERINLEPCYWGQLPGNSHFLVRKSTINTLNLASFASMHNYPLGKKEKNHWGEYVTILNTTSGTPYYFNFHVRDVGHTLIIGPTGAGKTVLMNFLCAQAQKFKPRMYFFDKDRGAEVFIRALRGIYTIIDPGKQCGFNPLQLPDTGENRTFLIEWLKILVSSNGEHVSAEDVKLLSQAIEGNYRLEQKDRKLCNITAFLGMDGPGTLASRISMWHSRGAYSRIFDNDIDSIDLSKARIFGFEMAPLLKDPVSLAPVLLYIFHRINLSLTGYPSMIVLDEAWALIDNPIFGPKIKDWLKVLRKLNTFVIFATQSVEDAAKSKISDTLIQQTATQIFLPNLKATDVYRTAFMLTQREFNLILKTDPSSRYFLIKQGVGAVVAKVDLSGMSDIINVLSGRSSIITMLDELRAEHGEDPANWLKIFYRKARSIK
ncbi:Type IV secretion system protein VirB4 [Candidatus Phycorickettsia trachydisci]|uniref:Type IV secretion system protein virB4 n=1 Tax=Candidatus Phycorickettsia trachydisci TaxID=2115978 RepID=A0A2P1P8E3_9RICK|nr:VirB4 family type IV secretion/conjugal transfer ATPase [Candidatus Phycorickettsia trachydisci]AVP87539.1 Type IV secretion system protein VirB4 [Candidatus Phycorickettsia trachydisci]